MAQGPEAKLQKRIYAHLQKVPHSWWMKVHGGPMQKRGVPDIIGCVRGHFVSIELKAGDNEPTAIQKHELEQIRRASGYTFVVRCGPKGERRQSEEDVIEVVECLANSREDQ